MLQVAKKIILTFNMFHHSKKNICSCVNQKLRLFKKNSESEGQYRLIKCVCVAPFYCNKFAVNKLELTYLGM